MFGESGLDVCLNSTNMDVSCANDLIDENFFASAQLPDAHALPALMAPAQAGDETPSLIGTLSSVQFNRAGSPCALGWRRFAPGFAFGSRCRGRLGVGCPGLRGDRYSTTMEPHGNSAVNVA